MHPLFSSASEMTRDIIGAAIEVHQDKGPGLLESIYEWCLTINFDELKRTDGVSRLVLPPEPIWNERAEETEVDPSVSSVASCSNISPC
jgi:hypothetical protein